MDGSRDPMTPVLDTVPPPSLHIKPGIVDKHNPELEITFPDIYQWPAGLYIQKEDYHSHTLEGNQCNKLLKNLDKLLTSIPPILYPFDEAFDT